MPLGTGRMPGDAITAADINGIATEVNLKLASTDAVARASVTSAKVAASETLTTAGVYSDLATVGPVRTVDIGASGRALVSLAIHCGNSAGSYTLAAVAVSGATVRAADNDETAGVQGLPAGALVTASRTFVIEGLTPGSNTFTTKYITGGGTATFSRRHLTVIPL